MISNLTDLFLANSPIRGYSGSSQLGLILILMLPFLIGLLLKIISIKNKFFEYNFSNILLLLFGSFIICLLLLKKTDLFSYYLFFSIAFGFSLINWGFFVGNNINKKAYFSRKLIEAKNTNQSSNVSFKLIFFIVIIFLIFINSLLIGFDFSNVVGADAWWHLLSAIRIEDVIKFSNPLFLDSTNHYSPLSYVFSHILINGLNVDVFESFNILAIFFNIANTIIFYLLHKRIIKNRVSSLLSSLTTFNIVAAYSPATVAYFFLSLSILFLTKYFENKKICFLLFYIISNVILVLTHLEFFLISLAILILFVFFKKMSGLKISFLIKNFLLKNYKFIKFPNENIIIFIGILFSIFLLFVDKESLVAKSEVPLIPYKYITFLSFFYFIYSPSLLLKQKMNKNEKLLFFSILALFLNSFFYFSKLHLFHHARIAEYSFQVVVYPLIVNELVKKMSNEINKFSLAIITLLTPLVIMASYFPTHIKASRYMYLEKINQINGLFLESLKKDSVVFIPPDDYVIRFFAIKYDFKIFSVNLNNSAGARPLTTIPGLLEDLGFLDIKNRLKISKEFMETGDVSVLINGNHEIDFMLIDRVKYSELILKNESFNAFSKESIVSENEHYLLLKLKGQKNF